MTGMTPADRAKEERLVRAFDDCFARIEAGATAEAALARWRDVDGDLAPLLGHAVELRTLFARVAPPAELVAGLERRAGEALDARKRWWRRLAPPGPGPGLGLGLGLDLGRGRRLGPALGIAAVVVAAILAGGIALAAASQPGDLLHPLKPAADRVLDALGLDALGLDDAAGPPSDRPSAADPPSGPGAEPGEPGAAGAPPAGGATTAEEARDRGLRGAATPAGDLKGSSRLAVASATARARLDAALAASSRATPSPTAADPVASPSPTRLPPSPTPTPTPIEPPAAPTERDRPPAPADPTSTVSPRPGSTPTPTPMPEPTDTPTHAPTTPTPTETATPEPRPEPGGIRGDVGYKDEEEPAPGIEVVARQIVSDPEAPPFALGETRVTESDGDGRFVFEGLPAGHWVVGAGDPRVWWETSEAPERADPIAVAPGTTRDGIRLRIARP